MKCDYCGWELAPGTKFCTCCGTRQEAPVEALPIPVPAPAPAEPQVYRDAPRYDAPPRPAPAPRPLPRSPRLQLPTRRGLAKMFFLGLLTLGIYPTVIWSRIATEINITASRYDGERTMPYFGMLALAPLTLGIYALVWHHHFCRRVGMELRRRRLDFTFDASDFWLWNILGSLILVGPFVYAFKLMRALNQINEDYNICG